MHKLTIKFESSFPRGAQPELRALLAPYEEMLREEVREVRVGLKTGANANGPNETPVASTATLKQYHFADICLDPSFFELSEDEKAQVIAHEATHVVHDIYAREVTHVLMHLVPEEMRPFVFNILSDAEERVVETLGHALYTAHKKV